MTRIRIALWALLLGLSVLWLASYIGYFDVLSGHLARAMALQYTGILSFGMMSVAMILAARSLWLDRWLSGLDKMYRLHKWLGIGALVTAITHWATVNAPHWAAVVGLTERPPRPDGGGQGGEVQGGGAFRGGDSPRPERHGNGANPGEVHIDDPFAEALGLSPTPGALETALAAQHNTALFLAEWAFYGAVALIAIALIKRIPYWLFAKSHTLIAVAYLALAFHAVVLMHFDAWTQPLGIVVGALMIGGVVSAVLTLTRQIGRRRQVTGTVEHLRQFEAMKVTEAHIKLSGDWPGHAAGQFAFVTFNRSEGAHPFTIASAWDAASGSILFISKALGDFTRTLPKQVTVGQDVIVEGPYGRFTFDDDKPHQIWIGAGIGITPFIARLKHLAGASDGKQIDLFHCVTTLAPEPGALLKADAAAADARLHLLQSDQGDPPLTGERLRATVPDWSNASVWFCGPAGFGEALRKDLMAHGLRARDFHQEAFDMR